MTSLKTNKVNSSSHPHLSIYNVLSVLHTVRPGLPVRVTPCVALNCKFFFNVSWACVIRCSFLSTDWVVKLGPASFGEKNLYQYAVVTDNFQIGLYVLARDVNNFRSQYDKEVLSWLAENGFTHFYNKPVATVQNENCLYPDKKSLYQPLGKFLEQK